MGTCTTKSFSNAANYRPIKIPDCPAEPNSISTTVIPRNLPIMINRSETGRGEFSQFEAPTAEVSRSEVTKAERILLMRALENHPLFEGINNSYKVRLINRTRLYTLQPREIVFEQHSPAINFYIVTEGLLEVLINGEHIKEIQAGGSFGERALFENTARSATVKTITLCRLRVIDRNNFECMLDEISGKIIKKNRKVDQGSPIARLFSRTRFRIPTMMSAPAIAQANESSPELTSKR